MVENYVVCFYEKTIEAETPQGAVLWNRKSGGDGAFFCFRRGE